MNLLSQSDVSLYRDVLDFQFDTQVTIAHSGNRWNPDGTAIVGDPEPYPARVIEVTETVFTPSSEQIVVGAHVYLPAGTQVAYGDTLTLPSGASPPIVDVTHFPSVEKELWVQVRTGIANASGEARSA